MSLSREAGMYGIIQKNQQEIREREKLSALNPPGDSCFILYGQLGAMFYPYTDKNAQVIGL